MPKITDLGVLATIHVGYIKDDGREIEFMTDENKRFKLKVIPEHAGYFTNLKDLDHKLIKQIATDTIAIREKLNEKD